MAAYLKIHVENMVQESTWAERCGYTDKAETIVVDHNGVTCFFACDGGRPNYKNQSGPDRHSAEKNLSNLHASPDEKR